MKTFTGFAFGKCFNLYFATAVLILVPSLHAQTTYSTSPAYTFTTIAGAAGRTGSADSNPPPSPFDFPNAVAVDSSGNVYVANTGDDTICKITPAGVITTLAGTVGTSGSADGNGTAAQFSFPQSIAVDGNGNIYVADSQNDTIRMITPGGMVTTLAGTAGISGSADGTGAAARFNHPCGVAVDGNGNVFVADGFNGTIRKITSTGVVTTFAGTARVFGSADGTGASAQFASPQALAVDSNGNVYVADGFNFADYTFTTYIGDTIRKITPAGVVTTLAGTSGVRGTANGTGPAAQFYSPQGIAVDGEGNVYVSDSEMIRAITPAGVVTTFAGTAGVGGQANGTGPNAQFSGPVGLAVDGSGNLFVADGDNNTIREITPAAVVTTFAGIPPFNGTSFSCPAGEAVDGAGNIYVADAFNSTIRKVTPQNYLIPGSVVTTLAGTAGVKGAANGTGLAAQFNTPYSVAVDANGNIYVADTGNNTIRKITPAAVVTTLAGTAGVRGSSDGDVSNGNPSAASFWAPEGVAVDSSGNVYVADTGNNTIRMITPVGRVTTLAGSAGVTGSQDGTGAAASFNFPRGVAVNSNGVVYVADYSNNKIREISPAGTVTTLAGSGASGTADGAGAAAEFLLPASVAVDGSGNVYVTDSAGETIREITPAGVVTTLAGSSQAYGAADGTGSEPRFYNPLGVAVAANGNVYVADSSNNTIREGLPDIPLSALATLTPSFGESIALNTKDNVGDNLYYAIPIGESASIWGVDFNIVTFNGTGSVTVDIISPAAVPASDNPDIQNGGSVPPDPNQPVSSMAGTSQGATIEPASQTISPLGVIAPQVFGEAPFSMSVPTATSGLPVTVMVMSGPATLSGNTITLTGVGTVVLAAVQGGNANYNAAPELTTSFVVNPTAPPSVTDTPVMPPWAMALLAVLLIFLADRSLRQPTLRKHEDPSP